MGAFRFYGICAFDRAIYLLHIIFFLVEFQNSPDPAIFCVFVVSFGKSYIVLSGGYFFMTESFFHVPYIPFFGNFFALNESCNGAPVSHDVEMVVFPNRFYKVIYVFS